MPHQVGALVINPHGEMQPDNGGGAAVAPNTAAASAVEAAVRSSPPRIKAVQACSLLNVPRRLPLAAIEERGDSTEGSTACTLAESRASATGLPTPRVPSTSAAPAHSGPAATECASSASPPQVAQSMPRRTWFPPISATPAASATDVRRVRSPGHGPFEKSHSSPVTGSTSACSGQVARGVQSASERLTHTLARRSTSANAGASTNASASPSAAISAASIESSQPLPTSTKVAGTSMGSAISDDLGDTTQHGHAGSHEITEALHQRSLAQPARGHSSGGILRHITEGSDSSSSRGHGDRRHVQENSGVQSQAVRVVLGAPVHCSATSVHVCQAAVQEAGMPAPPGSASSDGTFRHIAARGTAKTGSGQQRATSRQKRSLVAEHLPSVALAAVVCMVLSAAALLAAAIEAVVYQTLNNTSYYPKPVAAILLVRACAKSLAPPENLLSGSKRFRKTCWPSSRHQSRAAVSKCAIVTRSVSRLLCAGSGGLWRSGQRSVGHCRHCKAIAAGRCARIRCGRRPCRR